MIYCHSTDILKLLELSKAEAKETTETTSWVGGYGETRNRIRAKKFKEPVSLRQRAWLEGYLGRSAVSLFASSYFDYDPAFHDWTDDFSEIYRFKVNEAYLAIDTERIDVIAGKKMMRWGTGDGLNPMDLINPRDNRDPITTARADTRLPVYLAAATFFLPPFTMTGVVLPKAGVSELPDPGSPWEPWALRELRLRTKSGLVLLAPEQKPEGWFESVELGFRVSAFLSGFDLSLMYFSGYTDDPVFFREIVTFGRQQFRPRHVYFQGMGFAFAKAFSKGTVRGEFGYKPGLYFSIDPFDSAFFSDDDGVAQRDYYQWLGGVDYTFFTSLYLNLQFFVNIIEGGAEPLFSEERSHGFTIQVDDKFMNDDLSTGVRGLVYTSNEGYVIEPFAEYKYTDNWNVSLGFFIFSGPHDSQLGQFSDNDMIEIKVRYSL